ncbi:MAG: ABC transporter permease subunit [Planctomycetes bacterium]|nr:ABC transporter permease subunit [Planctomycetota bacterium]
MSEGSDIIDRLARPFVWLTGPILDKELRVASRRPRSYLFRLFFIVLLAGFIALSWSSIVKPYSYPCGSFDLAGFIAAQMGQMGKEIVDEIIWFQFWAMQLLAIVLVSNSIGEEIQQRTLGILATTPISGRQVVMGKLISKLLNLLLLLAVSLPVLAMVRVFGGAPLEFIVASLGTTFFAVLLAGAVTMFFASKALQPVTVILRATVAYGIIFIAFPTLVFHGEWSAACFLPSPYMAMEWTRAMMLEHYAPARSAMGIVATNARPDDPWIVLFSNWTITAGMAAIILLVASGRVMNSAIDAISGAARRRKRSRLEEILQFRYRAKQGREPKPISGSPFIWREMRYFLPGSLRQATPALILSGGILFLAYAGGALGRLFHESPPHDLYMIFYFGLGSFVTLLFASGTIAYERQCRVMPLLLGTPTGQRRIIAAKALSVFYRAGLMWGLMALHAAIFTISGLMHPLTALHLLMIVAGMAMFLCGLSMYASSRVYLASHALAVCLCLCGLAWAVLPVATKNFGDSAVKRFGRMTVYANPFVQVWTAVDAGAGAKSAATDMASLNYDWLVGDQNAARTTWLIFLSMLGYGLAGLAMLCLTARRLRDDLF